MREYYLIPVYLIMSIYVLYSDIPLIVREYINNEYIFYYTLYTLDISLV